MIDDEDYSEPRYYYKADVLAQIAEDRADDERKRAERETWLETHYVPDRPPPAPELRAAAKPTRHSMDERERHNLANYIDCKVDRKVAAAVERVRLEAADAIGQLTSTIRKQSRMIDAQAARIAQLEQRAAELDESTKRREFFESLAERISAIEQRAEPDNNSVVHLYDHERRRAGEQ